MFRQAVVFILLSFLRILFQPVLAIILFNIVQQPSQKILCLWLCGIPYHRLPKSIGFCITCSWNRPYMSITFTIWQKNAVTCQCTYIILPFFLCSIVHHNCSFSKIAPYCCMLIPSNNRGRTSFSFGAPNNQYIIYIWLFTQCCTALYLFNM